MELSQTLQANYNLRTRGTGINMPGGVVTILIQILYSLLYASKKPTYLALWKMSLYSTGGILI
ncbi:hypothetical protein DB41_FM00030 [Neochlamydia sp. TUME1]|uniref:hypothetical protein n=1 Tax=Neochlamydia sp. TUME1 TaxID=1478174 RepID=UPI00057E101D|nr:hypothetical protein [Neochlamydia sp. TUME1]KIC76570.1 hypothetical protein DB41_FM00030 [Neochlamydia sp. TUME1]